MVLAGNKWLASRGLYKERLPDVFLSSGFLCLCLLKGFHRPLPVSSLVQHQLSFGAMRVWSEDEVNQLVVNMRGMQLPKALLCEDLSRIHEVFILLVLLVIWNMAGSKTTLGARGSDVWVPPCEVL